MRGRGEFDLVTVAAFVDVDDRSNITYGKPPVQVVSGQGHAIQLFDRALWDRDPILLSRLTSATPRQEFMQPPLERGSAPTRWADPAAQILASLHLCGFNHDPSVYSDNYFWGLATIINSRKSHLSFLTQPQLKLS